MIFHSCSFDKISAKLASPSDVTDIAAVVLLDIVAELELRVAFYFYHKCYRQNTTNVTAKKRKNITGGEYA